MVTPHYVAHNLKLLFLKDNDGAVGFFQKKFGFQRLCVGTSNHMLEWPEARWVIIDLAEGQINYPLSGKQYSLSFLLAAP